MLQAHGHHKGHRLPAGIFPMPGGVFPLTRLPEHCREEKTTKDRGIVNTTATTEAEAAATTPGSANVLDKPDLLVVALIVLVLRLMQ